MSYCVHFDDTMHMFLFTLPNCPIAEKTNFFASETGQGPPQYYDQSAAQYAYNAVVEMPQTIQYEDQQSSELLPPPSYADAVAQQKRLESGQFVQHNDENGQH